jgi:magnesium-transporting ATPase (P-type)
VTTVLAFLPMWAIGGLPGKVAWNVPAVVVLALLIALFGAFFILPSHLSGARSGGKAAPKRGFVVRLEARYRRLLGVVLHHRALVIGVALTVFLAIMFGWKSPLSAIQLLWLNLISDGAPALALGVEKGEPDLMERPPRDPDEPILNRYMQQGIAIQTLAIAGVTLTAYWLGRTYFPAMAPTMAFVTLSFSELLRAFTARSERMSIFKIGVFSNKYMNYAVLSSLVLLLVVVYVPFLRPIFETVPLGWNQWRFILPLLVVPAVAAEIFKYLANPARNQG